MDCNCEFNQKKIISENNQYFIKCDCGVTPVYVFTKDDLSALSKELSKCYFDNMKVKDLVILKSAYDKAEKMMSAMLEEHLNLLGSYGRK